MIKNQPLISVIVPVYNAEKYIHRCVDSIINQTYTNLEIILVDDGSPDNSGVICDEYAEKDDRIVVIHKENKGVYTARNAGLDICTGEYIAFVDSDDYIESEMYEIMLSESLKDNVDICVCQWQYENQDGQRIIDLNKINNTIYGKKTSIEFAEYLYGSSYENGVVCAAWNKLYRKEIFETTRFYGRYIEDDRIHSEILSRDYSIFVLTDRLYIYCQNGDSLTNKPFREETLLFLDVLSERMKFFSANEKLLYNTRKLYCNMYIEYYYKAKNANIKMTDIKEFDKSLKALIGSGYVNVKFIIRMLLFRFSPKIYYELLANRKR